MFCLTISKILELFSRFPYVLALGDCEKKHYLHLEHRWGGIDVSMGENKNPYLKLGLD